MTGAAMKGKKLGKRQKPTVRWTQKERDQVTAWGLELYRNSGTKKIIPLLFDSQAVLPPARHHKLTTKHRDDYLSRLLPAIKKAEPGWAADDERAAHVRELEDLVAAKAAVALPVLDILRTEQPVQVPLTPDWVKVLVGIARTVLDSPEGRDLIETFKQRVENEVTDISGPATPVGLPVAETARDTEASNDALAEALAREKAAKEWAARITAESGTTSRKEKVVVVGLLPVQTHTLRERCNGKYDLRFFEGGSKSIRSARDVVSHVDRVIALTSFMSHPLEQTIRSHMRKGAVYTRVTGGVEAVARALEV